MNGPRESGDAAQQLSPHSRHHDILEDPDVHRWVRGMQARSRPSASVYRNHLARFCKAVDVSPRELAAMPEKEQADLLQDYLFSESDRGMSGKYLEKYVTTVQMWLRHNGKVLVRRIDVPHHPGEAREIRIPDADELQRVRARLTPQNCIRLDILALSGQRPEVMGMHGGRDGLRLGDIEDLVHEDGRVTWRNLPALVRVRSEISKNRKPYFFFLAEPTCELITTDLRLRVERGEQLGPKSPLVVPKFRSQDRHIHTTNIVKPIRDAMRKEGIESPPYAWRSYFSHFWMRWGGDLDCGEFYMGHGGGIAAVYRLRKQLPPESVDEMRAAYAVVAAKLLGGEAHRASPYAEVAATMLRLWGVPEDEVEGYKLADLSNEEVMQIIQQHIAAPVPDTASEEAQGVRQRIIQAPELAGLLEQGWLVKMQLSDGSFVVESA